MVYFILDLNFTVLYFHFNRKVSHLFYFKLILNNQECFSHKFLPILYKYNINIIFKFASYSF